MNVSKIHYWTDSSIVLHWMKATNKKLPVFSHKVGEIWELTSRIGIMWTLARMLILYQKDVMSCASRCSSGIIRCGCRIAIFTIGLVESKLDDFHDWQSYKESKLFVLSVTR